MSLLLCSLYKRDCKAKPSSNVLTKYVDDATELSSSSWMITLLIESRSAIWHSGVRITTLPSMSTTPKSWSCTSGSQGEIVHPFTSTEPQLSRSLSLIFWHHHHRGPEMVQIHHKCGDEGPTKPVQPLLSNGIQWLNEDTHHGNHTCTNS